MINEFITEIHEKVPLIIIKDFINLETETEIKMKFISLKFKLLHVQNRLIIRGTSAACRRILHLLCKDVAVFH